MCQMFCCLRWRWGWWRDWCCDRRQQTKAWPPSKSPYASNHYSECWSIWTMSQALPRVSASAAAQLRRPLPWHGSRGWLWRVGACEQTATSRYFILSFISAFFTCHIRLWGLQRAASELSGEKAERWPSLEVPGASGGDSRSVCYLKDLEGGDSDTGDGILAAAAREATASSSGEEKTQSQTTTASPQDQCITELLKKK